MPYASCFYWSRFCYCNCLREAPQLASVLREMKNVLDVVRSKVEALTALVRNLITYFCWILLY